MMLYTLQVYRGFAAIIVVFFHLSLEMKNRYSTNEAIDFFSFGHSGVEFFFVLSGFLIYYIHQQDIGIKEKLKVFLWKRFIRIYPIYWLFLIIIISLYAIFPSLGEDYHRDFVEIIKAILLFPVAHLSYNPVGWTLSHEILFYTFFSLLIINKRIGLLLLFIWLIIIIYTLFSSLFNDSNYLLNFVFSAYNILFIFGIVAALISNKYSLLFSKKIGIFVIGNILFIFTGVLDVYTNTQYKITLLLYGFSSFLIIVNSNNSKLNVFFKSKRILLLIGNASFSIYLVHLYFISFISKIFIKINIQNYFSSSLIYLFMALFSIAGGILIYKTIEEPLLNFLKKQNRKNNK